jgi:hypothetical protein
MCCCSFYTVDRLKFDQKELDELLEARLVLDDEVDTVILCVDCDAFPTIKLQIAHLWLTHGIYVFPQHPES